MTALSCSHCKSRQPKWIRLDILTGTIEFISYIEWFNFAIKLTIRYLIILFQASYISSQEEDAFNNDYPVQLIPLFTNWDKRVAFTPRIGRSGRFTPRIGRGFIDDDAQIRVAKSSFTPRIGRSSIMDDKSWALPIGEYQFKTDHHLNCL